MKTPPRPDKPLVPPVAKPKTYRIIKSFSLLWFTENVNDALAPGTQLVGGPFIVMTGNLQLEYCQAVLE